MDFNKKLFYISKIQKNEYANRKFIFLFLAVFLSFFYVILL